MQPISGSHKRDFSNAFHSYDQLSHEREQIELDPSCIGLESSGCKEFVSRHIDSTIWQSVALRSGDIILGSYAKSGTTWLQNILCQLVLGPSRSLNVCEISPWVESKYGDISAKLDMIDRQKHRRVLKTHLPLHCLIFSPQVKYLYIARDAADVAWSLHHHHSMANKSWYSYLNNQKDMLGEKFATPDTDVKNYFFNWLHRDGHPFWPYRDNVCSWWKARHYTNVLILHYKDLSSHFNRTVLTIASFLGLKVDVEDLQLIRKYTSFQFMQKNAELFAPSGGRFWVGGGKTFFNKGRDGEWRSVLSQKEKEIYAKTLKRVLGPECFRWVHFGIQDGTTDEGCPNFRDTILCPDFGDTILNSENFGAPTAEEGALHVEYPVALAG